MLALLERLRASSRLSLASGWRLFREQSEAVQPVNFVGFCDIFGVKLFLILGEMVEDGIRDTRCKDDGVAIQH